MQVYIYKFNNMCVCVCVCGCCCLNVLLLLLVFSFHVLVVFLLIFQFLSFVPFQIYDAQNVLKLKNKIVLHIFIRMDGVVVAVVLLLLLPFWCCSCCCCCFVHQKYMNLGFMLNCVCVFVCIWYIHKTKALCKKLSYINNV